jgi:hypothetical protein
MLFDASMVAISTREAAARTTRSSSDGHGRRLKTFWNKTQNEKRAMMKRKKAA